jgi:hypothetical protein
VRRGALPTYLPALIWGDGQGDVGECVSGGRVSLCGGFSSLQQYIYYRIWWTRSMPKLPYNLRKQIYSFKLMWNRCHCLSYQQPYPVTTHSAGKSAGFFPRGG